MLDILKEAYAITIKRRKERKIAEHKRAIAKAFNDLYTYRVKYIPDAPRLTTGTAMYDFFPSSGYSWMCPDCNRIHQPSSSSVWSGLQYPACCKTGEGNRLNHGIKTG